MARKSSKQVTWKVDRKAHAELPVRSYVADVEISPQHAELLEGKLEPGALFLLKQPMGVEKNPRVKPGIHPYIRESWDLDAYPVNSLAIYAGIVRVEESFVSYKGSSIIRAPRHSFIIGGIRCLITNLNLFTPVLPGHTS